MPVAAIILAAGASSRLGQPKQLLTVDHEPLLQRAMRTAREAGVSRVYVVLGAHHAEIRNAIDFTGTTVVINPAWEEGIASSIRAGVEALQSDECATDGILLMVCDQPRVNSAYLRTMIGEFENQHAPAAIASTYAGVRGIPAIFPPQAVQDLLKLRGDIGARAILAHCPWAVIDIPLAGGEIDIDRPQDAAQLR